MKVFRNKLEPEKALSSVKLHSKNLLFFSERFRVARRERNLRIWHNHLEIENKTPRQGRCSREASLLSGQGREQPEMNGRSGGVGSGGSGYRKLHPHPAVGGSHTVQIATSGANELGGADGGSPWSLLPPPPHPITATPVSHPVSCGLFIFHCMDEYVFSRCASPVPNGSWFCLSNLE